MKNFKKLFIYEAKRILPIPLILLTLSVISEVYDITDTVYYSIGKFNLNYLIASEETSLSLLYVFCGVLFLSYCYNFFALRKLYQKARIDERKLFWVRMLIILISVYVYMLLIMLFRSLHLGASIRENPTENYQSRYVSIFALQGKPWWYTILFPLSIVFTLAIASSIVVFIEKLIFSKKHFACKIIALVFLFLGIALTPYLTRLFPVPIFGGKNPFIPHLPVGIFTYQFYSRVISVITAVPQGAKPVVNLCYIAWNVNNYLMLAWGIVIIAFCYFSISFFNSYQNDDYSYKREIKIKNEK